MTLVSGAYAGSKKIVDCRLATSNTTECKTYTSKFMFSKKLSPYVSGHELIVSKTLPARPKPRLVKIISVEDMIEKHLEIHDPVRYKGSQPSPLIDIEEERQRLQAEKIAKEKAAQEDARKLAEAAELLEKQKAFEKQIALEKEKLEAEEIAEAQRKEAEARQKKIEIVREEVLKKEIAKREKELLKQQKERKREEEAAEKKLAEEKDRVEKESKKHAKYIVQEGDSLILIAKRFKLKTKQILASNTTLKDIATIRIGQKLTIPLSQKEVDSIVDKLEDKKGEEAKKSNLSKQLEKKYSYLNKKARKKAINEYDTKLLKATPKGKNKLRVQATAYTSHRGQTDSTPFLAAWNNRIRPGMKVIAVSRDLIRRHGLGNGKKVRIQGLPGTYTVRDKMNKRLSKHIDIYMGTDRRKALRWGRRRVVIYW